MRLMNAVRVKYSALILGGGVWSKKCEENCTCPFCTAPVSHGESRQ